MPDSPLIPPSVGMTDSPVHRLCINAEWWAHISGQISQLLYRDQWHGTESQIDGAVQTIYQLLNVGMPDDDCGGTVSIDYPRHATLWHDESTVLSGGAFTSLSLAPAPNNIPGQFYNLITYQSSYANGDSFQQLFWLDAGNYRFHVLGGQNQYGGKLDWYLDTSSSPFASGMDWYNAAVQINVPKDATMSIPTAGRHTLKGVVNGHTSPSGAYFVPLVKYWFEYLP